MLQKKPLHISTQKKTLVLASPRGFCAGVDRAIEIVERSLERFSHPLYVNHEIVHNTYVVEDLQKKGAVFTEDMDSIPKGETVIFSAHGVPPSLWKKAQERNLQVIDATCPLVTKVHAGVRRYAQKDYTIIYIGHKKHVETVGTIGEAPENIVIVEKLADVQALQFSANEKLAYLTQTTLSLSETKEIIKELKKKFPQIEGPARNDICYATTNRQLAVAAIAPYVSLMLVIGSKNSSNSNRLREVAEQHGVTSYLIDDASHIKKEWILEDIHAIGITAGASAPEVLLEQVMERLQKEFFFEELVHYQEIEEHVSFQLPDVLK